MMLRSAVVAAAVVLFATSAEARFGKKKSDTSSSSSSSSTASSTSGTTRPGSNSSSSSSNQGSSSGDYHEAVPVSSGSTRGQSSYTYYPSQQSRVGFFGARPWRYGFYSGAYVPRYGYGYGYYCPNQAVVTTETVELEGQSTVQPEPSALRVEAGADAMPYLNGPVGLTFGIHLRLEGERWGFALAGQNFTVRADDGTDAYDNLQELTLHLTYAFLSGKYGRLRGELGANTMFAPDVVMMGPTIGLSGSLWIGGPFALEGGVFVTPLPFKELDYQVGLAVGFEAVGLRAGWRTQILDDNGVVDGVVNRDVFMGPYIGVSLAL